MKFNVTVPVKPYVKRFLENNYGTPIDFKNHPRENEMFKRMLKKPCYDQEHKYNCEMFKYVCNAEIVINDRDFYRHGWELSKTDIISFGKFFERNAKFLMRQVVSSYVSFGTPVNIAIARFQARFNFEEEYWPLDSIQKDFYRFAVNNEIDFNKYAFEHLERLILVNMETTGYITNTPVKSHEKRMVESW
jgi:hypothetical protein